mgnify:CR=1 FL=1
MERARVNLIDHRVGPPRIGGGAVGADGVFERLAGHHVAGLQVVLDHLHDAPARHLRHDAAAAVHRRDRGIARQRHAKRLADLKAQLKLTPAQESAWTTFTTAMQPGERPARLDRQDMDKLTTPERIDRMRAMRAQHAAEADRRGEAIKAFYATLTPEQQKTFDEYSDDLGIFSLDESGISIEIKTKSSEYSYNLEQLKKLYYSPRKKPDTDKAIFRLSSIGIIDDYTVDYDKNCYKIRILKKTDDEYIEHLKVFMKKYYSANRVESEIENVFTSKGDTILQKCLSFLTDFVYKEIEAKRLRSIEDMILACEIGMQENGNEELKDFIHLYFNSKYAKENHEIDGENYSLTIDTDNAKEYSFDILWKYIKATSIDPSGAQKDNTKHLRGATLRLLRTEPRNGALLLLKAYSLFVLGIGSNKNIENEAKESLTLGFKLFRDKDSSLTFEKLSQNIESYKSKIIQNANNSKEVAKILDVIIEELYLEFHNDWLKKFNEKYLMEYEQ